MQSHNSHQIRVGLSRFLAHKMTGQIFVELDNDFSESDCGTGECDFSDN